MYFLSRAGDLDVNAFETWATPHWRVQMTLHIHVPDRLILLAAHTLSQPNR